MPQFARSFRSHSSLVASARSLAAILSLLPSIAGPAYPAGKGMWSPDVDWRQGGNEHKYAIHMALQPGDGSPFHSRILWFGGERFGQVQGGQWGWTPGGEGCSTYPSSNFAPISVPLSGLDLFCAGQSLVGDKIAVVGGTSPVTGSFGERKIRLLSAGAGTDPGGWSAPADMDYWRWYPTTVPLRDGRILALAGSMHRSHRMFGGFRNGTVPSTPSGYLLERQQPVPDGGWETGQRPLSNTTEWPAPRYAHTMVDFGDVGGINADLVFGGRDSAHTAHNDLWRLFQHKNHEKPDPQFEWWKVVTTGTSPRERSDHTAIRTPEPARRMIVFGGLDDNESPLSDVWRLTQSISGLDWNQMDISGSSPPVRYGHTAIYDETQVGTELRKRMIVFGGASSYNAAPTDQRVWELRFDPSDPNAATWHEMTVVEMGSERPAPRLWHTLSGDEGLHSLGSISNAHVALMFGGKLGSSSYSDSLWGLWILSDGTVGWQLRGTAESGTAPGARARHSAVFDTDADHAPFGRYYVFGGENASGPADSYLYTMDTWDDVPPYDTGWVRWADRGFTLSGHSAVLRPREHEEARIAEVFDPTVTSGDPWTALSDAPLYQVSYPPAFSVPGAGNEKSRVISLNVDTLRTYYLDVPKTGQPTPWQVWPGGTLGFRAMSGVQYRPGELMVSGGYLPSGQATGNALTLNTSILSNEWMATNGMAARVHHNMLALPTGQVLVVGGNDHPTSIEQNPVRRPQIWTPTSSGSGGSWTSMTGTDTLAEQPTARTYHSTAILLPDGRVLTAGGETPADKYVANLYCPPYLFDASGDPITSRPQIQGAPPEVTWGTAFTVCVDNTTHIQSACLIAPGATTHSLDMNQRFIPLTILAKKSSPARLHLTTPASPDSAPPGVYMLFVLGTSQGADVPSVARWVRVNSSTAPAPDELSISADLITCDAIGPIRWSAPGDNGCASRALDYDLRYSFSPITSDSFLSATPLSAIPDPATGGTTQTAGTITGLSPSTLVYLAGRTRSSAGHWSPLAYAELGTLGSCEGGGYGLSARRTRDEDGSARRETAPTLQRHAEASTLAGASTLRLAGEFTRGSPARWRLHYVDLAGDEARLSASSRHFVVDEPVYGGGWELRDSTLAPGGLAGVRDLPGPSRLIFPAGTALEAMESRPRSFEITSADHSELGELATSDSGSVPLDLAPGDTLDLSFRRSESSGAGEDCVFLVRLPGSSLATSARRPGDRRGADTPPAEIPLAEPLPGAFALHAAKPNPFSGETTLNFDLPAAVRVRIELFDVQGRRVAELLDQTMPAGRHAARWRGWLDGGGRAGAGIYLCRMTAGSFVTERRVTRLP